MHTRVQEKACRTREVWDGIRKTYFIDKLLILAQ